MRAASALGVLLTAWTASACHAPARERAGALESRTDAVSPASPAGSTATERMQGYFPNTELVSHDGRRLRFYDDLLRGKLVLIQFLYTRCDGV